MKYLRRYDTEELTSLETEYYILPTIPIYDIVNKKYGFYETVSDTYTFGTTLGLFEGNIKINDYTER